MNILKLVPQEGIDLVKYSKDKVVDKLGIEIIQNVVASILTGSNVRDLTEGLTQRRVLLVASSLLVTYLRAMSSTKNIVEDLTKIIKQNAKLKLSAEKRTFLFWFLGITGKSIQNVFRDEEGFDRYLKTFDENLASISESVVSRYGDLDFNVSFEGKELFLKWPNLLRILLAVGAQTLTIRGSEKSLYGKMFEKFVLGSVLSLLGFEYIDMNDKTKKSNVFWFSERENKREADATVLIRPGVAVRFDIGFIGRGNPEVSLDKVSRFERFLERGDEKYYSCTIILVDTIGESSRIVEMAKNIDGEILQMSETYWVLKLAKVLEKRCHYVCEITNMSQKDSLSYIKRRMKRLDIMKFQEYAATSMNTAKKDE